MVHITTKSKLAENKRTPRDVYFEGLEEAYGNLPVPNDDWADIKNLLVSFRKEAVKKMDPSKGVYLSDGEIESGVEHSLDKLQEATEVILEHYKEVAKALGRPTKYA